MKNPISSRQKKCSSFALTVGGFDDYMEKSKEEPSISLFLMINAVDSDFLLEKNFKGARLYAIVFKTICYCFCCSFFYFLKIIKGATRF